MKRVSVASILIIFIDIKIGQELPSKEIGNYSENKEKMSVDGENEQTKYGKNSEDSSEDSDSDSSSSSE